MHPVILSSLHLLTIILILSHTLMPMTQRVFSLLTFNCFGGLSWTTPRRLRTLAQALERDVVDIVCLQEVQTIAAQRLLTRVTTSHPSHAYGPGQRPSRGIVDPCAPANRRDSIYPLRNSGTVVWPNAHGSDYAKRSAHHST